MHFSSPPQIKRVPRLSALVGNAAQIPAFGSVMVLVAKDDGEVVAGLRLWAGVEIHRLERTTSFRYLVITPVTELKTSIPVQIIS